jgi:cytochrome b561
MQIFNSDKEWGAPAKFLHWLTALIVIGLFILGLVQVRWPVTPLKFELYAWHKSFGILVLALVMVRLCWRLANKATPKLPEHMKNSERLAARFTHFGFYAVLIAMPLSGWVLNAAANFQVKIFGLFALPAIVAPDRQLAELATQMHHWLGWLLLAIFGLHVAGVLKHHFWDKDDVLARMLPGRKTGNDG